jgi:hypothetical protein
MTLAVTVCLAVFLGVAACSSRAVDDGPPPTAVSYASGAELAAAVGCKDYKGGTEGYEVTDGGVCTIGNNHEVVVNTFADQDDAIHYADLFRKMDGVYVVGYEWVIGLTDSSEAQRIVREVGGTIHLPDAR